MPKNIPIHPHDTVFAGLMRKAAKAIRTGDNKILGEVKKKFAKANINLFYNKETDVIRVLKKDCPPIDFNVSKWTGLPKK